jgi:hypothetical protein
VFASVRDRLSAEQVGRQDADYIFDVPIEVAKAPTGFRHNEDISGAPDEPYEELERRGRGRKWWDIWRSAGTVPHEAFQRTGSAGR